MNINTGLSFSVNDSANANLSFVKRGAEDILSFGKLSFHSTKNGADS